MKQSPAVIVTCFAPMATAQQFDNLPAPSNTRPTRKRGKRRATMPDMREVLELLRKYDTPTVCNVVELFDVRPRTAGYTDGRIQACFPKLPPMVGYAATA